MIFVAGADFCTRSSVGNSIRPLPTSSRGFFDVFCVFVGVGADCFTKYFVDSSTAYLPTSSTGFFFLGSAPAAIVANTVADNTVASVQQIRIVMI